MICPKCGFEQPDATECVKCGVIVAKYKPRDTFSGGVPQGTFAPPGVFPPPRPGSGSAPGQVPPGMFAPPPPGAYQYTHGQTSAGAAAAFKGIDDSTRRRVEAQEATKRLIITLLVVGGVVMVLYVFVAVFRVYFNATKFELDVNQAASDLASSTPNAIRKRLMSQAEKWGFKVKDDRIEIRYEDPGGGDLAQMLLYSAGLETYALNVKIRFIAVGNAVGIPIEREMRGGAHIVVRAYAHEVRNWLDQTKDDYVGGRGPDEETAEEEGWDNAPPENLTEEYVENQEPDTDE